MASTTDDRGAWPLLPHAEWTETLETLHLWSQVVGKVRLVQSPWLNHSWSVPLYVSTSGLRTSWIPHGTTGFEIAFDFLRDRLAIETTRGEQRVLPLGPGSVAEFHAGVLDALRVLRVPVEIHPMPCEIEDAIPFPEDTERRDYVGDHARALWGALLQAHRVFSRFRAGYRGKASPVHFFWGSFDLAVTRFSGRPAPPHAGGIPNLPDDVAREAYSEEVTSLGFWPGNRRAPEPVFYAYAYPTPTGFSDAPVAPAHAFWSAELGEFLLPYVAVAGADDPDAALLEFAETTHAAAADLAGWDRRSLECVAPHGPDWWWQRSQR